MRVGNFAAGCFVFATREAFEAVGGFDTRLYVTEELALSRALKRIGRFVVLREHVVTSGRKLRTHSVREILRMTVGVSLRGSAAFRDRSNLSLWYGDRRNE
jgi:GT2 family glycosyltransferase